MMKIKETIERMKNDKLAINCPTEELAKEFLKGLHQNGEKWYTGVDLTTVIVYGMWRVYGYNTIYAFTYVDNYNSIDNGHISDYLKRDKGNIVQQFTGWDQGEIKEKVKTMWNIENGEEYWYSTSLGGVVRAEWNNLPIDKARRELGVASRTKEECQLHVDTMKAKVIIDKWINENDPEALKLDWENENQPKHGIVFNHSKDKFFPHIHAYSYQQSPIYLSSGEARKKLIKDHPEELKLVLGVKR